MKTKTLVLFGLTLVSLSAGLVQAREIHPRNEARIHQNLYWTNDRQPASEEASDQSHTSDSKPASRSCSE